MANNNKNIVNRVSASVIREEDLRDLEKLQQDIQGRVDAAHDDGRIYMMSQHVRILALVSSEVKKVRDRFDRESLAASRSAARELKRAAQAARDAEDETSDQDGDQKKDR
jgi:hypothetical protein